MKSTFATAACALALLAGSAQSGDAAVVMTFAEVGADVVGTLSGTLDIAGLTTFPNPKFGNGVTPSLGGVFFGPPAADAISFTYDFEGYTFGTGAYSFTAATGSPFGILADSNVVFLPNGFTSGGSLSGSMTFAATDFATLGITPGTETFTLPSADTITVTFAATVVPVPPALAALGSALLGLGWLGRRRRG